MAILKESRIKKEDIIFEDGVYFDTDEDISVYLCQTTDLDKIVGIDFPSSGYYQTNFYGTYNFKLGLFKVISITTLYVSEESLRENCPEYADTILEKAGKEVLVDLNFNELDMIFDVFKKYCIKDLTEYLEEEIETSDFKQFICDCSVKIA